MVVYKKVVDVIDVVVVVVVGMVSSDPCSVFDRTRICCCFLSRSVFLLQRRA